jgi:Fe-S cluster assembly ATPase SufC
MTHLPTSALFSFVDEETNALIAITGETKILEHIAGGEESTISVDGIVLLYGEEYVVSDIQINALKQITHFEPKEYDGLGLGGAIDYTVSVRLMIYPRF